VIKKPKKPKKAKGDAKGVQEDGHFRR